MVEINGLPAEQCAFVKKIAISQKDTVNIFLATIAYARNPRDGHYKMRPSNDYIRRRIGFKEEEYPIDELDQALFDALDSTFQNVETHTSFQMFDNQQDENRRFVQSRKKGNMRIHIVRDDWKSKMGQTDEDAEFSLDVSFYSFSEKDIEQLANNVCKVIVSNEKYAKIKHQLSSFHALEKII